MERIYLIIQREFRERVAKKSFIIVTILMPLLMLLLSCLPALIMAVVDPDSRTIAVVDESGIVAPLMQSTDEFTYTQATMPVDTLLRMRDGEADGVLVIPADIIDSRKPSVTLYMNGPTSIALEGAITSQLEEIIEQQRIDRLEIDNLKEIMGSVQADVSVSAFRIDREEAQEQQSGLSFGMGLGMSLILYMFLLIYGQMVMTSIIEEKGNRVLELVVTSVKPWQLMLGKIFGVASVAVVQILIWMVLLCCITAFVLPSVLPANLLTEVNAMNAGQLNPDTATYDTELLTVVSTLGSASYVFNILFLMLLFLVGGFLFYSSIFAAVGSAVDNIQDASQLQTIIVVPIILGLVLAVTVASDPGSVLGLVCSFIPFTAPMVMMARIPFGVPGWEIFLSLLSLFACFGLTAWLAGKIYRVGIFMYGKKPTFKDLWRWARQS